MATGPGSLSRHLHFDEFNSPLPTAQGYLSPTQRKALAVANLGISASGGAASLGFDSSTVPSAATNVQAGIVSSFGIVYQSAAPVTISTAGAATYLGSDVVGGTILRDAAGANRSDTLPTAALLVAAAVTAFGRALVGTTFDVLVANTAAGAFTVTLGVGTGGSVGNTAVTQAIPQNGSKALKIRLTNVTGGAEAYVVYA